MQQVRLLGAMVASLSIAGAASAAPVVTELSSSVVQQSERLFIHGSGFGTERGEVYVGDVPLAVTRWADDAITAYVTAPVPLGAQALRVSTGEGDSDDVALSVAPLPPAAGRRAWTFRGDGMYASHRPAVGPDGTVYASDISGYLYAISRDGLLLWIYDAARESGVTGGDANDGPVQVGADGTIYLSFNPIGPLVELHAIRPDGTNKWTTSQPGLTTVAGPAIGPDGNLYVAHSESERGLLCISPEGELLWNRNDPVLRDRGSLGAELVFGPSEPGGPVDQLYMAFDMAAWQDLDPEPSLLAVSLEGDLRFRAPVGGLSIAGGQRNGQPAVGPNGTVYVSTTRTGEAWGVHAFDPGDGSRKWVWYEIPGNTMSEPVVGDDGDIYVTRNITYLTSLDAEGSVRWVTDLGGSFDGPVLHPAGGYLVAAGEVGEEAVLRAHDATSGDLLWEEAMPGEPGSRTFPSARPLFADAGDRVYLELTYPSQEEEPSWALVALDVEACPEGVSRCDPIADGGVHDDDAGVPNGDAGPGGADPGADETDAGPVGDEGATPVSCGGCASTSAVPSWGLLAALALWRRRTRAR